MSEFDLEAFIPYRLNRAAETVSLGFARVYRKRHGLTRPEWRVLALLGAYGSMTATEIARRSTMHKTKVSRAVAALEERRWLRREEDEIDRRLEHLELTRAGAEIHRELTGLAEDYARAFAERLGPEGLAALERGLAAVEAAYPAAPAET